MFRPRLSLLPLTLLAALLTTTTTTVSAASDYDIGEVCGKLNGGGYTNHYLCSEDRKSVIVCKATIDSLLLPIWQLDRACHGDHFCYALQPGQPDPTHGAAPMEPNGYPSVDASSFGCRKLLGLQSQDGEGSGGGGDGEQAVMDGEGLRKRSGGSVGTRWVA